MVLTSPPAPTKLSFGAPSCSKCSPTGAVHQGWAQRLARHRTGAVSQDFALRGLRFGKLVPTADLDMIRLEPKAQLSGPKLASMDAWDKRHAPDPRCNRPDSSWRRWRRWVSKNAADCHQAAG